MKNALISVIIPIYNLDKYLPKCIDSVLAQTYTNLEVIPVDDGSSDNSAQLLKEYALKDNRVKPIFKENGGVSSARNTGLNNCTGDYIYFLDGDDWIAPNTIEKLYGYSERYDVVQASHIEAHDSGLEKIPGDIIVSNKEIENKEEMLSGYFLGEIYESSCNKLYRRSVIGDLRFDEGLAVAEDSSFVYNVLKNTKSIKLLDDTTYFYYIRENSCIHSVISDKHFKVMDLRDKQYKEIENNVWLFKKFIFKYAKDIFYLIHEILHDDSKKYLYRIPDLRKKIVKEKWFVFSSPNLSTRFKIGVLLLWLCPKVFYKLYSK